MLSIQDIANSNPVELAETFKRMEVQKVIALFDLINDAIDNAGDKVEPELVVALPIYLAALSIARFDGGNEHLDLVMEHMNEVMQGDIESIAQDLINDGFNADFAEVLASKLIKGDDDDDDAILETILECAANRLSDNPDAYHFPSTQLPLVIQDQFDAIEKIFLQVAKLEVLAHVYLVSAIELTGLKSHHDMKIAITRFERLNTEGETYGFIIPFECMEDGQHWIEDHKDDINNQVMQFIAKFI